MLETYLGTNYDKKRKSCHFLVWAPHARSAQVMLQMPGAEPHGLDPAPNGFFSGTIEAIGPGDRYFYQLHFEDRESIIRADPASRYQPAGVHGPSAVTDKPDTWDIDGWSGRSLSTYIIYEVHVGTYTPEGTFDGLIPHLERLRTLGITAIELMPIAQFPGGRNWGYDGVFPFAPQNTYGGPDGLRRLVRACHEVGLAVVLDVVYNHMGPEGNYLRDFGPYFTNAYNTPWGEAINFDDAGSDYVRRYFLENALYWISEFHIDALRLDAVHAIKDFSAQPFLKELASAVQNYGEQTHRRIYTIAESDLNDTRLIRPRALGGFELDAQWNDDFHHALHSLLTREEDGYYSDFGDIGKLTKAYTDGYVYTGEHSRFRRRRHGNPSRSISASKFVVYSQNHDQVGNRMLGDRLSRTLDLEQLKLAAASVILSPFIPLLFMGEEYGETAPFQYFISHEDEDLVELVRKGRKEEFAAFNWQQTPPDPQSENTFIGARLDHQMKNESPNRELYAFYTRLIELRRQIPALIHLSKKYSSVITDEHNNCLYLHRWCEGSMVWIILNFSEKEVSSNRMPRGLRWIRQLDSADSKWGGPGRTTPEWIDSSDSSPVTISPHGAVVYEKHTERFGTDILEGPA